VNFIHRNRKTNIIRSWTFMTKIYKYKSTIFWDITPCSPLKVNRRSQKHVDSIFRVCSACHLLLCWVSARLILRSLRWRRCVPSKRLLIFNGLHGVIFQKIVPFITTAVRTSNPTCTNTHCFQEIYFVIRVICRMH
jgi:hypothetical protein